MVFLFVLAPMRYANGRDARCIGASTFDEHYGGVQYCNTLSYIVKACTFNEHYGEMPYF